MVGETCMARGMCGRGACMAGGHAWWGVCIAGDMPGRGCAWPGGPACQEACVAGETATAADGTHPAGMHSCL